MIGICERPPIGVGADTVIEGAIVDKNCRIGCGVRIESSPVERRTKIDSSGQSGRYSGDLQRCHSARRVASVKRGRRATGSLPLVARVLAERRTFSPFAVQRPARV